MARNGVYTGLCICDKASTKVPELQDLESFCTEYVEVPPGEVPPDEDMEVSRPFPYMFPYAPLHLTAHLCFL